MIVRLPIVLFTGQPHYFYLHCYLLHLLSSSLFVGRGSVCALFVSHPCETLDTHAKASLPPYERSVGFASCKAFGRSFQASVPPYERSVGFASCKAFGRSFQASVPPYERSVGFASCKAFGRSFQASVPCLPLPLH